VPNGQVVAIHLAEKAGTLPRPVAHVRAVPGRGLEGDRYFVGEGTFNRQGERKPEQQATLIESEALEALARDYQLTLDAAESRRNLLTRGVSLNHLVGRKFSVGPVRMRGIELCEPCGHLEKLTRPGVRKGMIHRGGLRAQILTEGVITARDTILVDEASEA